MNTLIGFLSYLADQVMKPETLINLTLKVSLILAVAGLLNIVLYRTSAAVRHWLWSVAFLSVLIIPLASTLLPAWQLPVLPSLSMQESQVIAPPAINSEVQQTKVTGDVSKTEQRISTQNYFSALKPADFAAESSQVSEALNLFTNINWSVCFLLIWLAGVFYILTRLCFEIFAFSFLARRGEVANDPVWDKVIQQLTNRLGIGRNVRIVLSKYISTPLTLGVFRPTIILPINATSWTPQQRQSVLLHELAHVKRLDYVSNLLTHITCAVYWYNPLTWIAAKKVHLERELATDDFVLCQGTENIEYANQLLEIARPLSEKPDLGYRMVAMANHSQIKKRIQHILKQKTRRHAITRFSAVLSGLVVAVLILPVTLMHLQAKHDSETYATKNASLEDLLQDLKSDDPSRQKQAAWALGEREDRKAVPDLIETLKAENPEVRGMAAWALGEIKDKRSIQPLIAALNDPNIYVREMVTRAIGEHEDASTVKPLLKLLSDPDPAIRIASLWSLGEIGDRSSFYTVIKMLNDQHDKVRIATLSALRGIGCDPAFVAITLSLKDASQAVRCAAAKILGEFTEKPTHKPVFQVLVDYHSSMPSIIKEVFGEFENLTAVEYLIRTLDDPAAEIRTAAAETLGKIGHPDAVDALMSKLQDLDPDVRAMAVWALDEINI